MGDSYEREKKARLEMDKQRRKAESELTVTQEEVADLEREKKDIELQINKKDQAIAAKLQKALKELQGKVEISEEELEAERQARCKAEKQRGTLARELDDLGDRLEEAGGATAAQSELNKKREMEI